MNQELENYKASVVAMADSNSEVIFSNEGPAHACIVASTIFDKSLKTVNIYTESMSGKFSSEGEYLESLKHFWERNGTVSIIVYDAECLEGNSSKFIHSLEKNGLYEKYNKQITIKKVSKEFKHLLETEKISNQFFMTGDNNKFRVQISSDHKALVCFNNKEHTERLNRVFDKVSQKSEEVKIHVKGPLN